MSNRIDHFTVGTESLGAGAAALRGPLGVVLPPGGKHAAMSTHNCVTKAGDRCFMELLAIDPDAPPPGRARWFSMDDPATQERIRPRPRALCWTVSTDDLEATVAASPVDLGEIVPFSRGERSWRLTVPRDGHLPWNGLLPAFIAWSPGPHPSESHPDLGVRLQAVRLTHPDPDALRAVLKALGVDALAEVVPGPSAIAFRLEGPNGVVLLD